MKEALVEIIVGLIAVGFLYLAVTSTSFPVFIICLLIAAFLAVI